MEIKSQSPNVLESTKYNKKAVYFYIKTRMFIVFVLLAVHLDMIVKGKTNLMHNLFLAYFFNNPTKTTDRHLKRIISTNCCIYTVVPPDDGPRDALNM